jgi:hypothetical protein
MLFQDVAQLQLSASTDCAKEPRRTWAPCTHAPSPTARPHMIDLRTLGGPERAADMITSRGVVPALTAHG